LHISFAGNYYDTVSDGEEGGEGDIFVKRDSWRGVREKQKKTNTLHEHRVTLPAPCAGEKVPNAKPRVHTET